jgi:hypothetical protein
MIRLLSPLLLMLCSSGILCAVPVPGAKAPDYSALKPDSIKKWSGAEVLITGKFDKVIPGPVGLSDPPVRSYRLQLAPSKALRGSIPTDKAINAVYSIRSRDEPTFPGSDQNAIIALKSVRGNWEVVGYDAETKENLEQATLATSFPVGWTVKDGKLVSPWESISPNRPVLLVGDALKFSVEPLPAKVPMKFGNPDGDGEFKITLTNDTDKEIEVPALLTDGKNIQWNECLLIRCQDKTYPIPGATGAIKDLKAVVLKPKESVTGTVQALALEGPMWPKGGYRIEFQFCLGEKSATKSFYYLSKHHDAIRDASQKQAKEKK